MFSFKKSKVHFLRWLRRLVYLWVRSRVFPEKTKENIPLDPKKSTCYVLKRRSLLDLLILDDHCRREGLPRPLEGFEKLKEKPCASFIYMKRQAVTDPKLTFKDYEEIHTLLKMEEGDGTKIQIVPVSTFWGRNPGRGEKSLLRLLFFDDERRGFLQRIFTFFIHGKNVCCCFGKAMDLSKALAEPPKSLDQKAQKIHSILKNHFYEKQIAVLGPSIYSRYGVMREVLRSEGVKKAIKREAEHKKTTEEKVKKRAYKYIDEIAAHVSHNILRFLEVILKWFFKRLYKRVHVSNFEPIRELSEQHEIIYLPCHRSHMDYLLINYYLLSLGVIVPHTAAGLNMNFWPMGRIFRGGGGFFLRRSFNGNVLYKAVFQEYLNYLMKNRHPLCFYIEGGRSRTGRLLEPKMGLLSMVTEYAYSSKRKVYLVPINLSYDKMLDGFSYLKELRGYKKKNESFSQLFKARKVLKKKAGNAYLNFGEPIELNKELTNELQIKSETRQVASKVMKHLNNASVVSPISLFSLALLSSPSRSLSEEDLLSLSSKWYELLKKIPYSSSMVIFNQGALKENLKTCERMASFSRFNHPAGDVLYIEEKNADLLSYYRNTIAHLFLIPSIIASSFEPYIAIDEDELIKMVSKLYEFLKRDYFLKWDYTEIEALVKQYLDALISLGFLQRDEEAGEILKPEILTSEHTHLLILGQIIGPTLKQYCLFSVTLQKASGEDKLTLKEYEKECSLLAQKLNILGMLPEKQAFNSKWFGKFTSLLKENKFITVDEDGISCTEKLRDISNSAVKYLGPAMAQSLLKAKSTNPKA